MRTLSVIVNNSKLYSQIVDVIKLQNYETTSLDILDVMSQKGVKTASLLVLLKEMEEQGQISLRPVTKGMFQCYKVRLLIQSNDWWLLLNTIDAIDKYDFD